MNVQEELRARIRAVPDFPKPGILFRDISPLLADPKAFQLSVDALAELAAQRNVDRVIGIESRGFLWGVPLAMKLDVGFVPLRKAGKLPGPKLRRRSYDLEYGQATLELQDAELTGAKNVLIVDDLLATGGTARAAAELVGDANVRVAGLFFVIELDGLGGREQLSGWEVESLLCFGEGES
jgi:adenine phosphoribosyltransferase